MSVLRSRTASRATPGPTLTWERRAWNAGKLNVAGVDEVGRGAWAGPLTAAAVVVPAAPRDRARLTRALNMAGVSARDSKQLSQRQRSKVLDVLDAVGVTRAIIDIPPAVIDELGLGVANREAMRRAIELLQPHPEHALIDAFSLPELRCTHDAITRGDSICLSIALASIVAKTHRDALMTRLDDCFPGFGFADHKGYGTAAHAAALVRHGVTSAHRHSFAPVSEMLAGEE